MTDAAPPSADTPPPDSADARLSRIEAALQVLAAAQAAGPPPEGFARPGAPKGGGANPFTTVGNAVQVAQAAGYLPGGEQAREKLRKGWRKWPVVREILMVFRLYFDRRYSPTRWAQLGVPTILVLLVLNWAFFYFAFTLPIASQLLERLVLMVLAVLLFHVLAAEVRRYAEVLDYLARTGRG